MKRTVAYAKPYASIVAWGLLIKFIAALAELFLPMILEHLINDVAPKKDMRSLALNGVLMALLSFVALFGNIAANRLAANSSGKTTHDLRLALFKKTTYLQCAQVDRFTLPSLISRLTSDTYYFNQTMAQSLRLGVRAPILLVGGLICSFLLDPILACVLLACVPFVVVGVALITKKSVPLYLTVQRGGDEVVRDMQENITGVRVIKALSKSDYEIEKFRAINARLTENEFKANKITSLTNPMATLILNLGLVGIIAVGALCGSEGGTVLAFLSYFTIILNAMLGLSRIFVTLSRGVASAARIEEVLEADERMPVSEMPQGDADCKIQFKDVSFSYNGNKDNVEHVSFSVKAGQTLGIIGGTGSGKSTIVSLLLRLYDVTEGAVYVDGRDVRSMPEKELRAKFGIAFQNDFLVASTIRENVDYFRGLPEDNIQKALACAQASEFVEGFSEKENRMLTQKGSNLSGGQKQRLIVSRALAGKPEILVLDDSSSALDYATDAKLRKALGRDYADCTKVIVAQRVSSVRHADLILVLDEGRIVGMGRHEELLASCEDYRQIYNVQMGGVS